MLKSIIGILFNNKKGDREIERNRKGQGKKINISSRT